MAHINLLPWREELRRQKTVEYASLAGVIGVIAVFIVAAAAFYMGTIVDAHKARNQFLQNQIDILNTKLQEIKDLEETKANLLARMNVIQELQRSRPEVVHLFEELVLTIPEGVWLTNIQQSGKTLSLEGKAESNARVSAYMRNLENSEWLENPALQVIEADKETRTAGFKLKLKQETKGQEGEGEEAESS